MEVIRVYVCHTISTFVEFTYVFPEEVPYGLSLLRGTENQIDLIPSSPILNKPDYRTNPEETKES
ncbi:hypothetical protein CR513_59781, partial [Mucuna pruriens]